MGHMNHTPKSSTKYSIILTLLIIIIGTFFYFYPGEKSSMNNSSYDLLLNEMRFKAAYSPEGQLKVFVSLSPRSLTKLNALEGDSVPYNNVVIGFSEAEMMRKESLFANVGDEIKGFFGIDAIIGGVLEKTNRVIDDLHFLDTKQFNELNGTEGKIFVKTNKEGVAKVFYYFSESDDLSNFKLSEGDLNDYRSVPTIAGKTYYPLILGYREAEMMREVKLFSEVGDTMSEFFGKNVVVVGVIEKTDSAFDMMYVIPLKGEELE